MSEAEFNNQLVTLEPSLRKFAYKLTREKEDASDLVQDTLLKGLLNRDKFVLDDNFKAWIFTIMKNTFINNYRRSLNQNTFRDGTVESFHMNQTEDYGHNNPESLFTMKEMTGIIEQLNDVLRVPVTMFLHGYKYREISEELNMSMGTVKSRIFLSRKWLKILFTR
jgi:RNA polymerase sigma-70 factor (ECF subfamily)